MHVELHGNAMSKYLKIHMVMLVQRVGNALELFGKASEKITGIRITWQHFVKHSNCLHYR